MSTIRSLPKFFFLKCSVIFLALLVTSCGTPVSKTPTLSKQEIKKEKILQEKILKEAKKQKEKKPKSLQQKIVRGIQDYQKLNRVAYRILTKNHPLCERKGYDQGVAVFNRLAFGKKNEDLVRKTFNFPSGNRILSIVSNSSAYRHGLRKNDEILKINGASFDKSVKSYAKILATLEKEIFKGQTVFTIKRQGKIRNITVKKYKACGYPVRLIFKDTINAYADGNSLNFFSGIMPTFANENEIALVLAHELAHNTMKHISKKKKNILLGTLTGLAADLLLKSQGVKNTDFTRTGAQLGSISYSVEFEQEADYVGLYLVARAGYNINNSANYWRRFPLVAGKKVIYTRTTHPTSPERYIALEKTKNEIKKKISARQSLKPNQIKKTK